MKDSWAFRAARMRQSPSAAETAVFTALHNRITLEPLGSTVCFNPEDGVQVVPRERMTCELWERCMAGGFVTVPDFTHAPRRLAFYLDGEPHTRSRVRARDEHVDKCLQEQGWKSIRFSYRGVMGKERTVEVANQIAEEVNGK